MAKCDLCDFVSVGRGLFAHQWSAHHDIMEQRRQAATNARYAKMGELTPSKPVNAEGNGSSSGQQPDNNGNSSIPQPQAQQKKATPVGVSTTGAKLAGNLNEAVSVSISPRTFVMDSSLIWAAMEAAIREWHWPKNMTPAQFIDTYLFESYKQRGLLLGAYTVMWPQTPDSKSPEIIDNNGNGHNGHDGNGNGHSEATPDEYGQKEPDAVMASF